MARRVGAERRVGDLIEHAVVETGCAFAHDVKEALGGSGNVDHVVMTPAGVWVVETKAHWLSTRRFPAALAQAAAADLVVTGLVLGYLVFMFRVAIVLEDGLLRAAFGAEFERYAAGRRTPANRRWTFEQAVRNGEHRTLLGFAGALLLLGIKASLLQS